MRIAMVSGPTYRPGQVRVTVAANNGLTGDVFLSERRPAGSRTRNRAWKRSVPSARELKNEES